MNGMGAPPPLSANLTPQKLRLVCSYGGHILPRPHDRTLTYVGGETRLIVVDRRSSLPNLHHCLSKIFPHAQTFSLKYQLPCESLDSLISLTTDEDLENMAEEYDRLSQSTAAGRLKSGHLRLFLFPNTPVTAEQCYIETASSNSDDWFLNALNGNTITSEPSWVNCLLGLDVDSAVNVKASSFGKDVRIEELKGSPSDNGVEIANQDVLHSLPDSLETSSSFGSSSSSPSIANIPHVVDDNQKVGMLGMEEQFQQMSVDVTGNVNFAAAGVQEGQIHVGYEKVQQIQQQGQARVRQQPQQIPHYLLKQQTAAFADLDSPDSVSSEGSVKNPLSRQRQCVYQEPVIQCQSGNITQASSNNGNHKNAKVPQMQMQGHESCHVSLSQYDQIQISSPLHPLQQLVECIPAGSMPAMSYYPHYPPQQHHHLQCPIYFVPPSYSELAATGPSSHPQRSPTALAAYKNRAIRFPSSKPEMASGMYRATASAPQFVQIPSSQHQPQPVGCMQIQPISSTSAELSAYKFADPTNAQRCYTWPLPPHQADQFPTSASTALLSDASAQENSKFFAAMAGASGRR